MDVEFLGDFSEKVIRADTKYGNIGLEGIGKRKMSDIHNSSDIKVATMEYFSDLQNPWEVSASEGESETQAFSPLKGVLEHVQTVLKNPFGAAQDSPLAKAYPVMLALLVSLGLLGVINNLSAGGDVNVLKQHLIGQVHLSTGTHWARSVDDLNQLSWENGLQIMEALDNANITLAKVEALGLAGKSGTSVYAHAQSQLKKDMHEVNLLLQDRRQLEDTQTLLRSQELYSPMFKEYLSETQDKFYTLTHPKAAEQQASLE